MKTQIRLLKITPIQRAKLRRKTKVKIIKNKRKGKIFNFTFSIIEKQIREYLFTEINFNDKTRKGEYVYFRQLCHYFAKKYTTQPYRFIAAYFGGKDHSTINHSVKVIENYLIFDKKKREDIKILTEKFDQLKNIA